ncbi:S41 family peptidase [Euzebya tangerina]|uniref:S41 family peptidase n=1 Tax=Euzebya tangerina TaxID=591198 RepID=UPI000E312AE7|nr:S41 family peptidase [Euzebya tangerina]
MTDTAIDPLAGERWSLCGRVVTMNAADDVIEDGVVYIDAGRIVAVRSAEQPAPDEFRGARQIRSRGTIYPGLIELHNHMAYNILRLWDVPRLFTNRGQWPGHSEYKTLVSGPMRVLGRAEGYLQAIIRYVEAKALLAGVTTSQGIRLLSFNQVPAYYRGIVRNVEQTDDPDLPEATTRVADVTNAGRFRERIEHAADRGHTFLLHLAEGVDDTANRHFQRLRVEGRRWAINDALVGIHSTGLRGRNFDTMSSRGGRIVWSPLSNLLLYGSTTDVVRARRAGVAMGLGSDWSPTGSKNLLGELKAAHVVSQHALGGALTPRDLVAMATRDAAQIVNWGGQLGAIEAGKRADLLVVGDTTRDPHLGLIQALETDIDLVVINGVRRYGTYNLMRGIDGLERFTVGGRSRRLNISHAASHPLVADLSLTEARDRLLEGLANLPTVAAELERGSSALNGALATVDGATDRWVLDLDHEAGEEDALRPLAAHADVSPVAAAVPLSQIVTPLRLDPLTVADDPDFLPLIARQGNLPEFVKDHLPELYGQDPVPPSERGTLRPRGEPQADVVVLDDQTGVLDVAARRRLVAAAQQLLDGVYVHLDFKRSMHAVDPVQRLRLLDYRLRSAAGDPVSLPGDDRAFHAEMIEVFSSLRDLHTTYLLPEPYAQRIAFVPFLIEEYHDGAQQRRYLVSRTAGDLADHPAFVPGVEVTHWNGMPIDRAIADNARRQAGSNAAARHARGLAALTTRPLVRTLPPLADWITLTYVGSDGVRRELRHDWLIWTPDTGVEPAGDHRPDPELTAALADTARGFDIQTDRVNEMKKQLYAPLAALAAGSGAAPADEADPLDSRLPQVFRAKRIGPNGRYGYIRIFTFQTEDPAGFVDEFIRLAEQLPGAGLVIDVRGNSGGHIFAAEGLLQTLTSKPVRPEPTQFAATELVAELCRRNAPSAAVSELDLGPWLASVEQATATGAAYSRGHSITPEDFANGLGQRYYGPAVLIVDALCYSATDIFAAGFQDHGIGPVIGTADTTGAGGANVWSHHLLWLLGGADRSDNPFQRLPGGASFNVSVRRTLRVGDHEGEVVEDLGVVPDIRHHLTRRDLLEDNVDLIGGAVAALDAVTRTAVALTASRTDTRLTVHTTGIDHLQVEVGARTIHAGATTAGTPVEVALGETEQETLMITGLRDGEVVATRKVASVP